LKFEIDDAEEEWTFHAPFNYIHGRMLAGSFSDYPKFFERCFKYVSSPHDDYQTVHHMQFPS